MQASEERSNRLKALKEAAQKQVEDGNSREAPTPLSNPLLEEKPAGREAGQGFNFYSDPLASFKAAPAKRKAELRPSGPQKMQKELGARLSPRIPVFHSSQPSSNSGCPPSLQTQPPVALTRDLAGDAAVMPAAHGHLFSGPPPFRHPGGGGPGFAIRPPPGNPPPQPGSWGTPRGRGRGHWDRQDWQAMSQQRGPGPGRGRGRGKNSDGSLPPRPLVHPSMWEDPWAALRKQKGPPSAKKTAPEQQPSREATGSAALAPSPGGREKSLAELLEGAVEEAVT